MYSTAEQFQIQRKDDKFREYRPHARGNAARITDEQWEPYFELIRSMHSARQTRTQILAVLRRYGLEPSVAQLYAKMSRWGMKGYGSAAGPDRLIAVDTMSSRGPATIGVLPPLTYTTTQSIGPAHDSSEESQDTSDSVNCFSNNEGDSSDTAYDTEELPISGCCDDLMNMTTLPPLTSLPVDLTPQAVYETVNDDTTSSLAESTDVSSIQDETVQRLPSDLMAFVHSSTDVNEHDKYDILNEVASFLCATCSYSDAFVLYDAAYQFLKENQGTPMALVFGAVNCLRSATFKEQCQYAGSLMGEALASYRLLSHSSPYAAAAFSSIEEIGRELCVKSELSQLNILYTQLQLRQTSFSTRGPSRSDTNEVLLHCSDPFLLFKAGDRPELMAQSLEVSSIALARIVSKLSRWCCSALDDFNPVSMLPSAGFNPSDPVSVARFSTALSCHFVRKWSFLSLAEVLGHCSELLPPNRKEAASRLCKLAVRVLSTLAVYTIFQATGMTLRCISGCDFSMPEVRSRYISPLARHLDVLSNMGSKERILVFAEMNRTLYNRSMVYRQQMNDHCLTAYVRETGFHLAASLIRLKRELNSEVPQPMPDITRAPTPARSRGGSTTSRRSSDSASSMRNLAKRNLRVPGIMSKNGSHMRPSWTRRLSTDSNESWNFTTVTGLPAGPTPPESVHDQMHRDDENAGEKHHNHDENDETNSTKLNTNTDIDIDVDLDMEMNMF